ncbi:protein LTO1 homolog [Bacillus rossius redtenbacheri]|uniref:protein LTO1 homolog n=1 Tax=Bacillus rossius redtenbacheri TaxID=93214 RepID=UPI002FDE6F71
MSIPADISSVASDDINDVFDSIALSEERLSEQGYQEGLQKGCTQELGYYTGVLKAVQSAAASGSSILTEKIALDIAKLLQLLESFPRTNAREEDILALRDNIKAKFKKICSVLKINSLFTEYPSVSF